MIDDLTNPGRAGLVVKEMVTPDAPPCACWCECWCPCFLGINLYNNYNNDGWSESDSVLWPAYVC